MTALGSKPSKATPHSVNKVSLSAVACELSDRL